MMMEVDDDDQPLETSPEPTLEPVLTPVIDTEVPQISMQAMSGSSNYQTMRVRGWYANMIVGVHTTSWTSILPRSLDVS